MTTYDEWKTTDPAEYRCEDCGADSRYMPRGWTCELAACPHFSRDPNLAYDEKRDRGLEDG